MYAPHPARYADATGRLVSVLDSASNGFGSLAWAYDKNGNRQSETRNAGTMPYTYSPPNWLYQKVSDTRIKTVNGNTQSIGTASFTYDGFNRLVTSQTAAETTTYTYNALGQRIKKINQNGLATSFHYGLDGELLYEQDQAGNSKAYVWLNGRPLARIDNNQQIYYYHVDHLGTVQSMTDATTGAVVWKGYYEPFGSATVRPVSTIENNLRLPGQYYDRETGLHYNYLRDYDPTTGRYVEADPIGLDAGTNLYAYGANDPISQIDPMGLANGPAVQWMNINGSWTNTWAKSPTHWTTDDFIYSGEYCGPNWTGGQHEEFSPVHEESYSKPRSGVDQSCRRHDMDYYQCRQKYPCDKEARRLCMAGANRSLAAGASAAGSKYSSPLWWVMQYDLGLNPGENAPGCSCSRK
ncbi:RHS repeat-associated core domain-containing protein [Thiobacillus sp.]|jgi:RHS repeat-associated protein|uniref:RHS repeat domain-containing protein n=1 Tax=Thiobacillus sp. TaxID=924 RepID=UPI0025FB611B|nr:RHS repeat-associated core domain-containing protein [Thiobacillus sp.]